MSEGYLLDKIARFGDEYRRVFLTEKSRRENLSSVWWEALLFFFARAYYQGRRDTVSKKVHEAAVGVLNELFADSDKDKAYGRMKLDNWQKLSDELKVVIGKGKVGKSADIKLTIDTFKFIGSLPSKNIVSFSVEQIKTGKLREHYNQLQRSKSSSGIHSVGPKVASFYLRDLVSLYELDRYVLGDDLVLLQPIDAWVRKIALKIGLIGDPEEKDKVIRQRIVEACDRAGLSSVKFNQGAWFLGYHSFEIVLRNLDVIS
jgi:hypothetical protein